MVVALEIFENNVITFCLDANLWMFFMKELLFSRNNSAEFLYHFYLRKGYCFWVLSFQLT